MNKLVTLLFALTLAAFSGEADSLAAIEKGLQSKDIADLLQHSRNRNRTAVSARSYTTT